MAVENDLQILGLSTKEIRVYLALVELGKGSVQDIAQRVSLPRTTIYPFLNGLVDKGIVSKEISRHSTPRFVPSDPMSLVRLVDRDRESLAIKDRVVKDLIATISPALQGTKYSIPKLRFVEGKRAVESLLYSALPAWQESYKRQNYFTMWGYQDHTFVSEYRRWHEHAWKVRDSRETICLFSTAEGVNQQRRDKLAQREIRLLPTNSEFPCSIWVHADHILFAMTRNRPHYAVLLVDLVIANAMRCMFQMLWALTNMNAKSK